MDSTPAESSRFLTGASILSLCLLAAASVPMQAQSLPAWAAVALIAGLAGTVAVAYFQPVSPDEHAPLEGALLPPRFPFLGACAVLLPFAWWKCGGGEFRMAGVLGWVALVACWFAAFWPRGESRMKPEGSAGRKVRVGLVVVTALGAALCFWQLALTPPNPISDHAETLLDVQDLLEGKRPIFFPRNTGREPLKFYLLFVLVRWFGLPLDYLTLKVGTALVGVLAVPAIYLLGRELGGPRFGLLSSAFLAISRWHYGLARIGLRVTHAVGITAVVLWALLRYARRGDRASALWAGVAIGVGLYGYIPFRFVPLLVPILFLLLLLFDPRHRSRWKRLVADGFLIAGTSAVIFLPLLRFMVERPDLFWYRALTRATAAETGVAPDVLKVFAGNVSAMAVAFNWRSQTGWISGHATDPFLDFASGGLFLAGICLALGAALRGSLRWAFVLFGLFYLTLPSTLSLAFPLENPSVNRVAAVIPTTIVLVALPLAHLFSRPSGRLLTIAKGTALALLLAASFRENYVRYFVEFHDAQTVFAEHSLEMADVIRAYRDRGVPLTNVYLLPSSCWVDGRNISWEIGAPRWHESQVLEGDGPLPRLVDRPLIFIFRPGDGSSRLRELRAYGGREWVVPQSPVERSFGVYIVP